MQMKTVTKSSKEYPLLNSCLDRNRMTRYFNGALTEHCRDAGFPVVNTFDAMVDRRGLTKMVYFMDKVHLAQRALPLTMRAMERDIPGFKFVPPERYGWHIAKSWLHMVFKERKRLVR